MEIKILGAHNSESAGTRLVSILIDHTLALDAGGLTSSLSHPEQLKLKALLLTHHHFDHIRDVATLGLNLLQQGSIKVYGTANVLDILTTHLINGTLYPRLWERPTPEAPALRLRAIEVHKPQDICGYAVVGVPVNHNVPAIGYQVTSPEGKTLFYTGDTGLGLSQCWRSVAPDLLITEVTMSDRFQGVAAEFGHLTPGLLKQELEGFRQIKGYLPRVLLVHMAPLLESQINKEVAEVTTALGADIRLGYEGMVIRL